MTSRKQKTNSTALKLIKRARQEHETRTNHLRRRFKEADGFLLSSPLAAPLDTPDDGEGVSRKRTREQREGERPIGLVLAELKENKEPALVFSDLVSLARFNLLRETQTPFMQYADYLNKRIITPLYDWQEESIAFVARREADEDGVGTRGLMLCHEPGLGKTLISLEYVLRENQQRCRETGRRFNGTTLIVCKDALLVENWLDEAQMKWPRHTFHFYRLESGGGADQRLDPLYLEECCDFIITTYSTVKFAYRFWRESTEEEEEVGDDEEAAEKQEEEPVSSTGEEQRYRAHVLYGRVFKRIIADEGHEFANPLTLLYRAMIALRALSRWDVTATPIQNSWQTIYSSFNFIGLDVRPFLTDGAATENEASGKPSTEQTACQVQPSADQMRVIDRINAIVMLRKRKCEINLLLEEGRLGLFTSVTKRIRIIEFESLVEKVLYFQYAIYGSKAWHHLLLPDKKRRQRRHQTSAREDKTTNVAYIIQLMIQLCTNLLTLPELVVPRGMLLLERATQLPVVETCFNEAVLPPLPQAQNETERPVLDQTLPSLAWLLGRRSELVYNNENTEEMFSFGDDYIVEYRASLQSEEIERVERGRAVESALASRETVVWDAYGGVVVGSAEAAFDLSLPEHRDLYALHHRMLCERVILTPTPDERDGAMLRHLAARAVSPFFCSTKNRHVIHYIREEAPPEDKIVVFSNSIKALVQLAADLAQLAIVALLISGQETSTENAARMRQFADSSQCRVLLLSLKLGSAGLNITCANHIVFLHPWWNPMIELQAENRCARIGQTKPIYIIHFIMNKTIELFIAYLAYNKKRITTGIIDPIVAPTTDEMTEREKKRRCIEPPDLTRTLLSYNFARYAIRQ